MVKYTEIENKLDELKISCTAGEVAELVQEYRMDGNALEFLNAVLDRAKENRRCCIVETLQRFSKIPVIKRLEDFDFSYQPSIDEQSMKSFATLSFIEKKENLIFIGDPGTGKSHLAISYGELCIAAGLKVYYITMLDMIQKYNQAVASGKVDRLLRALAKPSLLIIDEVGYKKLTQEETEFFFAVVSKRYERGSIIITSNFPLSQWGNIFSSIALAGVIVDRLAHHSHIVKITGPSYRIRDRILQ